MCLQIEIKVVHRGDALVYDRPSLRIRCAVRVFRANRIKPRVMAFSADRNREFRGKGCLRAEAFHLQRKQTANIMNFGAGSKLGKDGARTVIVDLVGEARGVFKAHVGHGVHVGMVDCG